VFVPVAFAIVLVAFALVLVVLVSAALSPTARVIVSHARVIVTHVRVIVSHMRVIVTVALALYMAVVIYKVVVHPPNSVLTFLNSLNDTLGVALA